MWRTCPTSCAPRSLPSRVFSETLLDGALNDEEVLVEFLEIIHKESSRLDAMVNDILQLSKLEQRQISGVRQTVDVGKLIEEVLQDTESKNQSKADAYRHQQGEGH
ncbi:MAG: histidine kinase dimerization/phospho-acceptor domain-containing protein [Alkalibacterium sp.]|nr:histidine kinase dimerization/phospho-acceptor domain-containing protein [Alkalibacterium sp.]